VDSDAIGRVGLLRGNEFAHAHQKSRWMLEARPNTSLESRHHLHSVEDRTSLHFLTLQNGHFLGKRERLSTPKGILVRIPESQRLNDARNAPYLQGFSPVLSRKIERPDWLAGEPVQIGPVSDRHSLLTGNFTGNFANFARLKTLPEQIPSGSSAFVGKFPRISNREIFPTNRD
jgi:hypothetical protein